MKKLINIIILFLVIGVGGFFVTKVFTSCGGWFEASCQSATAQQQDEQQIVTDVINRLIISVPVPQLKSSLERKNISRRLELFSDESKVSYIYLTSYGKVMAFYTVKGKITSGNKRLTSTERQVDWQNCNSCNTSALIESPELDGTYGSSNPYIFFWTTDGTYVQWNGEYMLADQPLKLSTPPELVREIK